MMAYYQSNMDNRQVKAHPLIEIDKITKVFRSLDGADVIALEDVSLEIGLSEFVSIVGPSGCGKSTLLRLVAGLSDSTEGRIMIDGNEMKEPRRDIGMVFQSPTLLPWTNIIKNVLFPLKVLNRITADSNDRARELLKLVGLEEFENKMPSELSGGMQQRAAICRALITEPKILLMDEPFGALDALTREEMGLELQHIWTERPTTIVFVTHSVPEAVLLSDKVCVMSARPGCVKEIIEIPHPRPRSYSQETEQKFQRLSHRIRGHIFENQKSGGRSVAA